MEGLITQTSLDEEVMKACDFVEKINSTIASSQRIRDILKELRLPSNRVQKFFELKQAILESTRVNLSNSALEQYRGAMKVLEEKGDGDIRVKEAYELSCIFYKVLVDS